MTNSEFRDLPKGNDSFLWDLFPSEVYFKKNYETLREDDRQLLLKTRDHFLRAGIAREREGIDVGTGSNLSPAITMFPYSQRVTLWEPASTNIAWLQRELGDQPRHPETWDEISRVLSTDIANLTPCSPRNRFMLGHVKLQKGNIAELSKAPGSWDIGTMFFVAESYTEVYAEFLLALKIFTNALKPGAPYAIALMEGSTGYTLQGRHFPAVAVSKSDVRKGLEPWSMDLKIHAIPIAGRPLRPGYSGMLLACGRTHSNPVGIVV